MSGTSHVLSYIEFICFNSLLMRKRFINLKKCYQISYNFSELEKFCFNIKFRDGYLNSINLTEVTKVACAIARVEVAKNSTKGSHELERANEVIESSFLTSSQINSLIGLFESTKIVMKKPVKSLF